MIDYEKFKSLREDNSVYDIDIINNTLVQTGEPADIESVLKGLTEELEFEPVVEGLFKCIGCKEIRYLILKDKLFVRKNRIKRGAH